MEGVIPPFAFLQFVFCERWFVEFSSFKKNKPLWKVDFAAKMSKNVGAKTHRSQLKNKFSHLFEGPMKSEKYHSKPPHACKELLHIFNYYIYLSKLNWLWHQRRTVGLGERKLVKILKICQVMRRKLPEMALVWENRGKTTWKSCSIYPISHTDYTYLCLISLSFARIIIKKTAKRSRWHSNVFSPSL